MGVRQTRFDEDGNCLQAAVATVTGIPLAQVINVLDGHAPEAMWFERLQGWGLLYGWLIDAVGPEEPPVGVHIAVGPSPRREDQLHAIVAKDGKALWDPNPSDHYLLSVNYYITLHCSCPVSKPLKAG